MKKLIKVLVGLLIAYVLILMGLTFTIKMADTAPEQMDQLIQNIPTTN